MLPDLYSDPFGETSSMQFTRHARVLGGQFRFDSNSRELIHLVESAYAGLPQHRLAAEVPKFHVRLVSLPSAPYTKGAEPPPLSMLAGGSLLAGATAQSSFVAMSPRGQGAIVVIAPPLLRHPYHARYELLEFAVFTLAARAQGLVALHGACVGKEGRGLLLLGPSGSGKSTVALHALLHGLEFLAEDSVFVAPQTLCATGVANFLHVRADSLRWLKGQPADALIRASPVIRRRSGVKKFEVDLRHGAHRLAPTALQLTGVVFLSAESAGGAPPATPLSTTEFRMRLLASQAYAAGQPPWETFDRNLTQLDAFELRRGRHPRDSVAALETLLERR